MQALRIAVLGILAAGLAGCGGSGSASSVPAASVASNTSIGSTTDGTAAAGSAATSAASGVGNAPAAASHAQAPVPLMLTSGGASKDWAKVAVRITSVSLVPQSGGAPVTVYTASPSAPPINLEQLDHVSQLLATVAPAPGTYAGAVITLAANPGDVALTSSDDPDSGFAGPVSAPIPPQDIQIQGGRGSSGAMSVAVPVKFAAPYVVSAAAAVQAPLAVHLSLADPAFVQSQTPVTGDPTLWAVDFHGAASGGPIANTAGLVMRQMYGTLRDTATDGRSITIGQDFPTHPVATPETAVSTSQRLTLLADSGNGTQFNDLDAGTSVTVSSFAALAGLEAGRYLRISARYQPDGSLVASQIWASGDFSNVWAGPEGHVTQVDAGAGTLAVEDAAGHPVQVQTDANTEFYYQGSLIATGGAFLGQGDIERGFTVRVSPRDPKSGRMLAQSIDIESALFTGAISNTSLTGFTYTSQFPQGSDDYTLALDYIAPGTANGTAANGTPISGYSYSNFAYPTEIVYGQDAAADFQLATSGSLAAQGLSVATWNDPASPNAWALRSTILLPEPLGLATVTSGLVTSGYTSVFSITPLGSTTPMMVQLITASGSAPLVYEAHRDHGSMTMTALDVTSPSGLAQLSSALTPGTYVNVFALPKSSGAVQAYTLMYYAGIKPREAAPHAGTACDGTFTGVFAGNLTVTSGQDCVFSNGATIDGNIKVEGGTLQLAGATVRGQVQVQGGGTVSVLASSLIEGDLQIEDVPAGDSQSKICGATIQGNLQYRNNGAPVTVGAAPGCSGDSIGGNLQVDGNSASAVISGLQVGGNLQIQDNTGPAMQVSGNVVGNNLLCENNASITGGGNSAHQKQGQCASL